MSLILFNTKVFLDHDPFRLEGLVSIQNIQMMADGEYILHTRSEHETEENFAVTI